MTSIFFVRHAQPQPHSIWPDDRTRPLTASGMQDRKKVTSLLQQLPIDMFFSSPYKRSVDTISECAEQLNMTIHTDERFRERQPGVDGYSVDYLESRWNDFDFHEKEGESLNSVQQRNIEALNEILNTYLNKSIVIGTHGTAMSTILNYYDSSFNCDSFKRIWHSMPYVIRVDFDGLVYKGREELLNVASCH